MGSLNDSFQSSNFLLAPFVVVVLYFKTCKAAINRPIKIRTHHIVRKHMHRLTNGRQAVRADRQLQERLDGQMGRFE